MKKKILFVYPKMMTGGSTTSLISLLKNIDYKRYEVDLLLYRNEGELIGEIPKEVNLLQQACRYNNSILDKIWKLIIYIIGGYFFKVYKNKKRYINTNVEAQIMAYWQCEISRKLEDEYHVAIGFLELWANDYVLNYVKAKKKIAWLHVDYENARYIPSIDEKTLAKANNIVCVSNECLNNFNNSFPKFNDRVTVIQNIISFEDIISKSEEIVEDLANESNCIKIITVCRLEIYTKGLDRILVATNKLVYYGYDFKWYIVGDGTGKGYLESKINEYGLQENLILLGKKLNPYPYMKQCNIFAMPSRHEGKPMAVTEAQVLGLPIIVTNYSSAKEQVNDGVDGIIVENSDESIYYGVKEILDKPWLINKFRNNLAKNELSNHDEVESFYKLIDG